MSWRLGQGRAATRSTTSPATCGGDTITLTQAIARSDNCAFVRTELSLGPGNFGADGVKTVIQTAKAMGINTSNFQPVVSTTLGTQGVHPLEMAQAYSVLANDGVLKRATFVTKIVDRNGKMLYQAPTERHAGARPERRPHRDADAHRSAAERYREQPLGTSRRPAAGKTGTTDDNQDAWFVGYTPQFTAAVWMGDPNGEIPMTNVGGIAVFGATYPGRHLARSSWRTRIASAAAVRLHRRPTRTLWTALAVHHASSAASLHRSSPRPDSHDHRTGRRS